MEESGTRNKWRDGLPPTRQAHEFPMLVPKWARVKEEEKLRMVTATAIKLSSWEQTGIWSKDMC